MDMNLIWVLYALICAISLAAADTVTKVALGGRRAKDSEYLIGWLRVLFAAPGLAVVLLLMQWPTIGVGFYPALALGMPLELLAAVLYIRALKVSPMNLTLPFLAFTPVFVIVTGFLIAGEKVNMGGIAGIMLIVIGSYALNFNHIDRGILGPIKAIGKEKGSMMMLAVAFIFSITATLIKVGINNSSPMFYGAVYFLVLAVVYAPLGLKQARALNLRIVWLMLLAGVLNLMHIFMHMLSVSLTNVAYQVSVKRTSLLFGVMMGYMFFKEARLSQRLGATGIMFAGFVLVVLSSL
jgi:drug/metabolite transporter (DMT)-like permease